MEPNVFNNQDQPPVEPSPAAEPAMADEAQATQAPEMPAEAQPVMAEEDTALNQPSAEPVEMTEPNPVEAPATPTGADQPVEQLNQPPKKPAKKLYVILAIITAIAVLVAGSYLAYGYYTQKTGKVTDNTQTKDNNNNAESKDYINPSAEAAASTLTGSSVSESSLTSTDESNIANEASTAAENVGGSVNEDSF